MLASPHASETVLLAQTSSLPASLAVAGRLLLVALVVLVGMLTGVRLVGLDRGFPLVPLMTVFPYIVALGVVVLLAALALGPRWVAVAAGVVVLLGAALLAPRVLPGPSPEVAPDGPVLTVAVANLREGNGDADAIVTAVTTHDVDVLLTTELTEPAIDRLEVAGLADRLPETNLLPSRFASGGGIYSRWPLEEGAPISRGRFGGTPSATLDVPGIPPVVLFGVHPLPPITPEWTDDWAATLADLLAPIATDAADDTGAPVRLLAGDFNATHDHVAFRELLADGWVDAAAADGSGLRATFSGIGFGDPVPPVTIDHVLTDPRVAVEEVVVEPLPGSDHRIVVARLRLPAA
jgi:endonuclease/exonuclease/phosphatase (EEP) superfamily protein YafD